MTINNNGALINCQWLVIVKILLVTLIIIIKRNTIFVLYNNNDKSEDYYYNITHNIINIIYIDIIIIICNHCWDK